MPKTPINNDQLPMSRARAAEILGGIAHEMGMKGVTTIHPLTMEHAALTKAIRVLAAPQVETW